MFLEFTKMVKPHLLCLSGLLKAETPSAPHKILCFAACAPTASATPPSVLGDHQLDLTRTIFSRPPPPTQDLYVLGVRPVAMSVLFCFWLLPLSLVLVRVM